MTFEDTLRSEVRRQAHGLVLPDRTPAQATARARQLRSRRRAGVATVAVAAALAAALPPVLDEGHDTSEMGPAGLPATGPLDLTWEHDADGLSNVRTLTQDGDGTLYALSTAPRTSAAGMVPGPYARGLYRLEDDGTWASLPLDGDPSYVEDLAAAGGGLYAISTAPTPDGGVKATLAGSSDEGASWAPQDVELPAPPSDAVDWREVTTLEVESTSSATLAVVATSWRPDLADLFPETADGVDLVVEQTDAGYELRRIPNAAQGLIEDLEDGVAAAGSPDPAPPPATGAPTTTVTTVPGATTTMAPAAPTTVAAPTSTTGPPTTSTAPPAPTTTTAPPAPSTTGVPMTTTTAPAPATTSAPTTAPRLPTTTTTVPAGTTTTGPPTTWPGGPPSVPAASGGETVRTVTWADLGVEGPDDLGPAHQVLRLDGDEWVAMDGAGEALDGLSGLELDAAAGGFVATGFTGDQGVPRAFTSDDGSSWAPITAPNTGAVHAMGSALVTLVPDAGGQVSTDAGATWSDFDLTGAGVDRNASCPWSDAGPLGVAMVCQLADGAALAVSSDLRDWTVTPLRDIVGADVADSVNGLAVHAGDDRIVLASNGVTPATGGLAPSATAVGVPTRS